jgi:SAM-dependent methyltransferase
MKGSKYDIYNLNQLLLPVFEKRFNFSKLRKEKILKKININERIIEIPFVLQNLHMAGKGDLKILDLGCMESSLPIMLASMGYKVYGVDIRKYPYFHPNLNFLTADARKLPFKANTFDIAIAISVIEHLGLGAYGDIVCQDADSVALEKIYDCLKDKGLLFLTAPFGVKSVNKEQRVYDLDLIKRLFDRRFTIKKIIFSAINESHKGNPVWEIVSLEDAEKIVSRNMTNAVALCISQKL